MAVLSDALDLTSNLRQRCLDSIWLWLTALCQLPQPRNSRHLGVEIWIVKQFEEQWKG
jgi:hypothetical protein